MWREEHDAGGGWESTQLKQRRLEPKLEAIRCNKVNVPRGNILRASSAQRPAYFRIIYCNIEFWGQFKIIRKEDLVDFLWSECIWAQNITQVFSTWVKWLFWLVFFFIFLKFDLTTVLASSILIRDWSIQQSGGV